MTRYLVVSAVLSVLLAGSVVGCGGGGTNGSGSGTATSVSATEPQVTATDGAESTPTEFEMMRDELSDQLDAIGANIGAVPDDVRDQMLASCHELEQFVDGERVGELCDAIQRAIETDDPGLVDLIVKQFAELEPD
jgi:hypothetical protein